MDAARDWSIDIFSMSLGFEEEVGSIRDAIVEAEKIRKRKVLFFAAANNDGLHSRELFPAFHESVISVRGTGHDGSFVAQYNPPTYSHKADMVLYGTLSKDVACGWVAGRLTKSGCSVATPIMAAIAAMAIQFVSSRLDDFTLQAPGLIRTRRGMLSLFQLMTKDQVSGSKRMSLAPWQLFESNDHKLVHATNMIRLALSSLPPEEEL